MIKELEALKRMEYFVNEEMGIKTFKQSGWHIEGTDDYEMVKEALQRLESIDNANPSEALKFLKQQAIAFEYSELAIKVANENYDTIKNYILKAQEQEKVLEIIFEKYVDLNLLDCDDEVEEYNRHFGKGRQLTEQEFDLLKRWLG